ncbi:endonuclease/exonuclease/phosphatase family protein [Promicromonospora iranensis]|uniref:Endonuclease/exonuclease/phosphatase (EEP) superfamily protein YafD n=1 Tax=Promicromonospora iranensis TaxID=1105144 RepID=A0ABU2CNS7_9MICO|nr:endonuclease/exonuclease/phosphatase family protein [Promicromonospora iranensis]MDR7382999.1 endonuclease/exonuclease/phosphatase (EEP) superfamily protein YafD [Promicromonospora iranensis]
MRFVHGFISVVLWIIAIPLLLVAVARLLPFDNVVSLPHLVAFTPWATLLTLPLLIIVLFARRRVLTLLLAVAMAGYVYWTAPFFVPPDTASAADPADAGTLRVMTINALYGQADARSVVDLVESQHVEVLAVQELTPAFEDALADAGLDELLAHSFTVPADDSPAGSGLWSSTPLSDEEELPGTSFAMPSALVGVGGTDVRVTVVHPHPPMPTEITTWRTELVELTEQAHADDTPQILAGDFNATYDHATFRDLLGSRFSDATREWGAGPAVTWPEAAQVPPLFALDHVVVEKDMPVSDVVTMQVPGTDHRALLATVVVE